MNHYVVLAVGAMTLLSLPTQKASAQLPATGYTSTYAGVRLDGNQCVPAARSLSVVLLKRTIPLLGANGVAADLWTVATPGFAKVAHTGRNFPPARGSLLIWSRQLGGTGHVAFVIGVVDPNRRIVRVVDSNWDLTQRGKIHDVVLDAKVLGWLVPQ